jgi:tetratricopeptide (TPR) repeat protein
MNKIGNQPVRMQHILWIIGIVALILLNDAHHWVPSWVAIAIGAIAASILFKSGAARKSEAQKSTANNMPAPKGPTSSGIGGGSFKGEKQASGSQYKTRETVEAIPLEPAGAADAAPKQASKARSWTRYIWLVCMIGMFGITYFSGNNIKKYNHQGVVHMDKGEYSQAIADFDKSIENMTSRTELATPYLNRGYAYYLLKDYMHAVEDYSKAIKINENLPHTYRRRGKAFLKLDNVASAVEDLKRAIRQDPKDDDAYYFLAVSYEREKKNADAITNYRKYLSLAPKAEDRPDVEKRIIELLGK